MQRSGQGFPFNGVQGLQGLSNMHQMFQQMHQQQQRAQPRAPQAQSHYPQAQATQAPRQQQRVRVGSDLIVTQHNCAFQLQERVSHSLILNGHNNQIVFNQPGQKIMQATVNGHNNYLYAQQPNCSVDVLIVQGHNNRFEHLQVS